MDKNKKNQNQDQDQNARSSFPIQFPVLPAKWIEDMDTNHRSTSCGQRKCFLPSRTTNHQRLDEHLSSIQQLPTQYGYLVAPLKKNDTFFERVVDGWELASHVSEKFSIRHFLRGPPLLLKSSEDLAERLKSIYRVAGHGGKGNNGKRTRTTLLPGRSYFERLKPGSELVVQPIEVAPDNIVLFKNHDGKRMMAQLSKLVPLSSAAEKSEFENRLRFDWNATLALMNSAEGRCLHKDFQLLIDPGTGGIYHLDFDRCFSNVEGKFAPGKLRSVAVDLLARRTGAEGSVFESEYEFEYDEAFGDPSMRSPKKRRRKRRIKSIG